MSRNRSSFPVDVTVVPGQQAFALAVGDPDGQQADLGMPGLHTHPDMLQIILATSGQAACVIDGLSLDTSAPMLITVPGGAVHGFRVKGRSAGWAVTIAHHKVLDLMVNRYLDIGALLHQPHAVSPPAEGPALEDLSNTLRLLCAERSHSEEGAAVAIEALQHLALVQASRMVLHGHNLASQPSNGHRGLFLAFRELVERNFEHERRVSWYVDQLRCSQPRLNFACRSIAACSAKDVILDRLVEEARRRLSFTRLSATRIGFDLGFSEPAYFLRFFRKRTGMTPAGFRREQASRVSDED